MEATRASTTVSDISSPLLIPRDEDGQFGSEQDAPQFDEEFPTLPPLTMVLMPTAALVGGTILILCALDSSLGATLLSCSFLLALGWALVYGVGAYVTTSPHTLSTLAQMLAVFTLILALLGGVSVLLMIPLWMVVLPLQLIRSFQSYSKALHDNESILDERSLAMVAMLDYFSVNLIKLIRALIVLLFLVFLGLIMVEAFLDGFYVFAPALELILGYGPIFYFLMLFVYTEKRLGGPRHSDLDQLELQVV